MKFKLSVALLSLCGLTAGLPARADAFDSPFMVARESAQRDWRDAEQARRANKRQQQEQSAEEARARRERESERSYGYGYERRTFERDDVRGRR